MVKQSNKQKNKQKIILPVREKRPAKKPTVTDLALREFINHLISLNKIEKQNDFAQALGFATASPFIEFMKGKRNYPLRRVDEAIVYLRDNYNANETFLRKGEGKMYTVKPYKETEDDLSGMIVSENIVTIKQRSILNNLKEENERLIQLNQELLQQLKEKERTITLQDKLIKRMEGE